jgi:hypothetical protein
MSVKEQQAIPIVVATMKVCYGERLHRSAWADSVVCWNANVRSLLSIQIPA